MASKLIGGTAWNMLGAVVQTVVRIGTLAILARLLDPAEFGLMAAVSAVILLGDVVSNFGLAPALVQRKNVSDEDVVTAQTMAVLLAVLLMAVVIVSADAIAAFMRQPQMAQYLGLASVVFLLHGLSALSRAQIERRLDFRKTVVIETVGTTLGYAGVVLPLAFLGYGTWALVWAYVAQAVVVLVMLLIAVPPVRGFWLHRESFTALARFGFGDSLALVLSRVAMQVDTIVISRALNAEALGLYSRASNLVIGQTKKGGAAFQRVLFPILSKLQDEPERLAAGFRRTIATVMFGLTLVAVACFMLSEHIILLLLGAKWQGAVVPFQILILAIGVRSANRVNGALLKALGRVYLNAWLQAGLAVALAIGCSFGARYGVNGVAVAVSVVFTLHFVLKSLVSMRLNNIPAVAFMQALQPAALAGVILLAGMVTGRVLAAALGADFWITGLAMGLGGVLSLPVIFATPPDMMGPDGIWLRNFFLEKIRRRRARKAGS